MRDISFSGVDGVDLVGWETGSGPTIVLLHAGRERAAVWVPVAEVLCGRHDLHCVAIDQRGHGASGGDAERISDYGADLRQVLASQDGPCVVVGASLGGFAAIDALRFPEARALVAGIVLIDVVPDPDPVRVRRFLGSIGMDRTRDHLIDDILAAGSRLSKLLSSSGTPVHLVWATGSAIDADEVRRLQRSATGLGVTPIDTGHLVAAEAPTQLAEVIAPIAIAWLREMAARH